MTGWHHSGTRRDLCVLLHASDGLPGQRLKTRLEARYDHRIEPERFYAMLDALVEAGHVERHTEGIQDVYALTERGEQALREHVEWLTEHVESD